MSRETRILIIEDDIKYGELLKDAFSTFGYEVILAYSATGGMDIIRQTKLDLIISDVHMPHLTGIELAKKLLDMCLGIPVVLITGINDLKLVKRALEIGVSDYVIKPLKMDDIPTLVERNLERKRVESKKLQDDRAEALMKALRALMRALDAKDPYTCGHSQRVVRLAMLMAEELNLSSADRYTLQLGAYLHDIGKIGIPDNILNKADDLEDYEFRIAKDHPIIGSQIIGDIEELTEVASIVRHHHERFDGQGYPDGLKGEAIPFFARIIAIIDCYEALVSNRVYRKAIDKAAALKEIQANSGKQFDPELVQVFLRVMEQELSDSADEPAFDEMELLRVPEPAKEVV